MKTIIVDMMGGDLAPAETVKGVALAAKELGAKANYILVGDRERICRAAEEAGVDISAFELVHTPTVITMEDDAICVTKTKKDSSMSTGLSLLAEGRGDAFVSTGNTGALYAGSILLVRKVKGVRRPCLAALLPMTPPVLLADAGANVQVTPEDLEYFATMGRVYVKHILGVENPRVGLLNNGAEEHKGGELQIAAYQRLSQNSDLNFVGNVEGNRVMQDACDVLVTDGYTGNILLKAMEGMGKLALHAMKGMFYSNAKTKLAALLCRKHVGAIKKNFDAREFGGAPILGVAKPVIKAHGSSDAKAFKNAIRQALMCAEMSTTEEIAAEIDRLRTKQKRIEAQ